MRSWFRTTMSALTPRQYAICAAVFIASSIAACLLAWWFVRKNRADKAVRAP